MLSNLSQISRRRLWTRSWLGMFAFVLLWLWTLGCNPDLPPNKPCLTDVQCDVGEHHCIDRRCVPMMPCFSQQQCETPKFQCLEKFCRKSPLCNSDADCANPLHFCFQNYCVNDQPLQEVALLYLTFDKKSSVAGEVWEESVFGRKGNWEGKGEQDPKGYRGEAGRFNGQDAYLVFSHPSDFARNTITVEAWINPQAPTKESELVAYCDTECRNGYALRLNDKGQVTFQVSTASDTFLCAGKSTILAGTWTHVRGSYDGQKLRCFVNGVLDGSLDWKGTISYLPSSRLEIGGRSRLQRMFAGRMDDVVLLSGGETQGSSPGQTRYLYLAAQSGEILALDTKIDRWQPEQSFSLPEGGWPVALSTDGKTLFLWNSTQQTIISVDTSTRTKTATVKATGSGSSLGALATYHHSTQTLWMWGDTTHVFALPLLDGSSPKATFSGLGPTFGQDVTWLASRRVLVASDPEGRQIHHFDPHQLKKLDSFSFKNNPIDGEQPLALGVNPESGVLYVSFQDSFEMQLLSPSGAGYQTIGSLTIQENSPEGGKLDRQIARMAVHPRGEHIYYMFAKPGFLYRLDLKANIQYIIREGVDKKQIPLLTTLYYPHLHHTGEKTYMADGNKGVIYVIGTQSHKIEKIIQLGKTTVNAKLPLVGVTHANRVY